jgi:hypothetical protein
MKSVELNGAVEAVSPLLAANGARMLKLESASEIVPDEINPVRPWPILSSTAALGIVGEIARLATWKSEADPIAVMGTTLAFGAAAFGRSRWMHVGDSTHHSRLSVALVGASSRARKGTSIDPVRRIFSAAESALFARRSTVLPLRLSHGPLSSGEGLIDAIKDRREGDPQDTGGTIDKRLLCIEGEFGAVLRALQRQGNNLGMVLRVAWDGWTLAPLTKHDKVKASDPHICIIAHVTGQELKALLTASDVWNGFANRFLWLAVRRGAIVPFPQPMPDDDVARIGDEIARVIEHAHNYKGEAGRIVMSNSAQSHWADAYAELTQEHAGIFGAVTSRAEAQALRLAMTFALFDGSDRIELKHVEAALTFWRYASDSAAYIFGGAELDPVAQRVLEALKDGPKTQSEIVNLFSRHQNKDALRNVMSDLQERGRITMVLERTAGRPRSVWMTCSAS